MAECTVLVAGADPARHVERNGDHLRRQLTATAKPIGCLPFTGHAQTASNNSRGPLLVIEVISETTKPNNSVECCGTEI